MINLGTTDIYINVPAMPREAFENYSTELFDKWDVYIGESIALPDYSLSLNVEEGSIKVAGTISAVAYAVYMGIGNYGSFISGVETIKNQVKSAGDFLAKQSTAPFDSKKLTPKVTKTGGALSQLQSLFVKVQSGKLTVDEAMIQAEKLLGEDAANTPELVNELNSALKEAPLYPQQIPLPLDTTIVPGPPFEMVRSLRQKSDRPPKVPPPLQQQLRVEVWRESRNEKRKVRVVSI